jgi:hypothetical protein
MSRAIFLLPVLLLPPLAVTSQTDSLLLRSPRRTEIGLNITNTLVSFFGTGSSETADPFLLAFRAGSETRRWRFGANFRIRRRDNIDDLFNPVDETERTYAARVGYEWVRPVSNRFALYYGVDAVVDGRFTRIESFTFSGAATLEENVTGFGGGPLLGLRLMLHRRVALTTETTLYAMYRTGYKRVVAPPDIQEEPLSDFLLEPRLPTALYLNFVF